MFFEVTEKSTYTRPIKEMVSQVIFAVPIVNNDFKINIETQIDASIDYELWDNNGNKLWSQKFEVSKTTGEPITIPVNPDITLPSGVLINKFIYSDGSVSIINTVK